MAQEKSKARKHAARKPWRLRVKRRKLAKFRKRWQRHHGERAEKRARPKRPHLMAIRLRNLAIARDSAVRSARMKAYHARRRAAQESDGAA